MAAMDDWTLVARAQRGDRQAVEELLQAHYRPLARALIASGCPAADVEDLVQEAFIRALLAMRRFENRGDFGAWLRRIAVNLPRDRGRRCRELPASPDRIQALRDASVEGGVDGLDLVGDAPALRLLDDLPPEQRYALTLRFLEDRSLEEIARITQAPIGTVKSRIHYGLRRLRRLLEQAGALPGAPEAGEASRREEGRP